ncbi:MAG TPA: GNAT family N-acetyltransferase [Thermoplasmata archaeon]|nr:GNAT family N-acetyltransferase [Thermoplasmata archaeon]
MAPSEVTLHPTIDRSWLEQLVERDPSLHAFSLWDLDRFPTQVRFVSARIGEETIGYLLLWLGDPKHPIVQWFGETPDARALLDGLPAPPFGVVVPERVQDFVQPHLGAGEVVPLRLMEVPREATLPDVPADPAVRRLTGADRPQLTELAREATDFVASAYPSVDPDQQPVWGYFENGRLRGVARTSVQMSRVWMITGVYVHPGSRSRGYGLAITRALLGEGHRAGATVALYVREDRPAPRAVYAKAGFRERARRVWLGVGTILEAGTA